MRTIVIDGRTKDKHCLDILEGSTQADTAIKEEINKLCRYCIDFACQNKCTTCSNRQESFTTLTTDEIIEILYYILNNPKQQSLEAMIGDSFGEKEKDDLLRLAEEMRLHNIAKQIDLIKE
jgi:hypothetical protein